MSAEELSSMSEQVVTPAAPPAAAPAAAVVPPVDAAAVSAVAPEGAALTGTPAAEPKTPAAAPAPGDVAVKWGDMKVDEALAGKFSATAKELGLDSAKAQKVADLYVEAQKAGAAQMEQALAQQNKGWVDAMKADKEIGGAAYNESIVNARKALTKFATPEFSKAVDALGIANHPEFVRVFTRIGKAMAEDSIGGTNGGATAKDDANARLRRAYPSMFNADGTPKAMGEAKPNS